MKLLKRNPLEDLFQYLLNGLEGLALDTCVMLFEHMPMIVHDDRVGADGSDINAQIKRFHLLAQNPLKQKTLKILIDSFTNFQVKIRSALQPDG